MFTITLSHSSSTNKRFAHHCLSHIRSPFLIHAAFRVLCRIIALSSVLQLQLYMFRVCPVLYTYSTVQYVCASRFFSLLIFHVSFHLICNEISRRVVFICNCLLCPYIMSSEWKKKNNVCFFSCPCFQKKLLQTRHNHNENAFPSFKSFTPTGQVHIHQLVLCTTDTSLYRFS